jgi:hypothetical protein
MMVTSIQVTFDCADPDRLASFWAKALGYRKQDPPEGYATWPTYLAAHGIPEDQWNAASAIVDPEGRGPRLYFQRVPEPKVVKNRVHLDLNVGGGRHVLLEERRAHINAAVERLRGVGATQLRPVEERGEYWVVMADPEGNEFCLQ